MLNGIPIKFITTLGKINSSVSTSNGAAKSILNSDNLNGNAYISATVNSQTIHTSVVIDHVAPKVKTIDPGYNAIKVPTNKIIKITFSESIKSGTMWIELKKNNSNT